MEKLEGPIAIVLDTTEFAGAELYAAVLVEHLRDTCKFVALLGSDSAQETRARLAEAGAEVLIVPGLRRRPSPAAVIRLLRLIRAVRPTLVHVNLSDQGDGLGALATGLLTRRPLVATLHLVIPGRARWREAVSRFALRRFRAVIAVSHAVGRYLGDRDVPAVVVMNGLDPTPAAHDPRGELGLDGDGILVGGVGRLHEQKGWDILCRAAALVRRERPDATFAVIGGGGEWTSLTSMPECEEVRFLGYRRQAASLIPAFDILAVPSRYEGLGLTPLEALFQGVPVVASNIEGLAEVLGDCAVLVPPENPEALAGAILHVASDAELRADLVKRGRERAHRLFSAERMSRETFAVYRDAASSEVVGATVQP